MNFFLDHDVPEPVIVPALVALGHRVTLVRNALPPTASDQVVLQHAKDTQAVLITCNRDDFLRLAQSEPEVSIIILVRRTTRAAERNSLLRLIDQAGEVGLTGNINFA